mmetsp:Transcript_18246/g.52730  ORF Transcript_18246/g.52730 Transcript_18246/m.52730 type:complete len:282 (-) Transcript_18246:1137-1982(-)
MHGVACVANSSLLRHVRHVTPTVGEVRLRLMLLHALEKTRCRRVCGLFVKQLSKHVGGLLQARMLEVVQGGLVASCSLKQHCLSRWGQASRVAEHLVDADRLLLALDAHDVEPAAHQRGIARQGLDGRLGAKHGDAVDLAESFKAAGGVDGVPDAPKLHFLLAADVAAEDSPGVQPDPNEKLGEVQPLLREGTVEGSQLLLLRQGSLARLLGVIRHVARRVPVSEQPISEQLRDDALIALHDARHCGEVASQQVQQLPLVEALGDRREVANVREHDCDNAP